MTVGAAAHSWRKQAWPYIFLLAITVLFYLPALIGTDVVNSDSAIIGLQAKHFLHGEFDWFEWGRAYQGSFYAAYMAVPFALFGRSPWLIASVPLPMVTLCAAFAFLMLRKCVDNLTAALASLLVILSPQAVNSYTVFPIRYLTLAMFMASLWILNSAATSPRWRWKIAGGTLLGGISLYSDYFVLQMLPALAVMLAFICFERPREAHAPSVRQKLKFCALGAILAAVLFLAEWLSLGKSYTATSLGLSHFPFNLRLLWGQALPYAMGYRVQIKDVITLGGRNVSIPFTVHVMQCIVAAIMGAAILSGIVLALNRKISITTRRLGLVGGVAAICSVASFLVSVAPIDIWSARYLAPILLLAPLAIAPLATVTPKIWFRSGLITYLCFAAAAGWISQRRDDALFLGKPDPIHIQDQQALHEVLQKYNVHHAIADYWLAYRLTFFFDEDPIVVPFLVQEDRYPPYRQAFTNATRSAMIFHPDFPSPHSAGYEQFLKDEHYSYQRVNVGQFLVFIVDGPRHTDANH